MQKKLQIFLFWLVIAFLALPASILVSPTQAQASTKIEKSEVSTVAITEPKRPNENGWFNQVTVIKLKTNDEAKTYYKWNEDEWVQYEQPFRAWKGINSLSYYSVLPDGTKEAVRTKVIKVTYGHPENPKASISASTENAKIAWENKDFNTMIISKQGDIISRPKASSGNYIDKEVKPGEKYVYKLKAVNEAGIKSKAVKISVVIPSNAHEISQEPKVVKNISTGISTQSIAKTEPNVKPEKVDVNGDGPVVGGENPGTPRNWNKLFIALSILIIAAGAAIAGYFGYEWWLSRNDQTDKKNNRW